LENIKTRGNGAHWKSSPCQVAFNKDLIISRKAIWRQKTRGKIGNI